MRKSRFNEEQIIAILRDWVRPRRQVRLGDMGRPFGPKMRPEGGYLSSGRGAASVRRLGHHGVRLIPGPLVDDRGVLAGVGDAFTRAPREVRTNYDAVPHAARAEQAGGPAAPDLTSALTSLRGSHTRPQNLWQMP
jgi:hypothetical protein